MVRKGPSLWHAMVRRSDGTIEDPSIEAGMRRRRPEFAPAVPMMARVAVVGGAPRPNVAVRPVYESNQLIGWQARCDVPMSSTQAALCQLHYAPVASQAIVGACAAAADLGQAAGDELVHPDTVAPIDAISGLLMGVGAGEVDNVCGQLARERAEEWITRAEGTVGDLFGDISHFADNVTHVISSATHTLQPIFDVAKVVVSNAQGLISLIPGIGTGISSAIGTGMAMLDGGSPLDVVIRTAYSAIPIPPGIKYVTDIVLDGALKLLHGGDLGQAVIAAARSKVPSGFPQQIFDTLIHLIIGAVHKRPTLAVAHPKPGVHPSTPVKLVQRAVVTPPLRPGPPMRGTNAAMAQAAAQTARVVQAARARVRQTTGLHTRPVWMTGLPTNANWVAPAGVSF
jgi:hypothetical protein